MNTCAVHHVITRLVVSSPLSNNLIQGRHLIRPYHKMHIETNCYLYLCITNLYTLLHFNIIFIFAG